MNENYIKIQIEKATYKKLQKEFGKENITNGILKIVNDYFKRTKRDSSLKIIGSFETKDGNWSKKKDWRS